MNCPRKNLVLGAFCLLLVFLAGCGVDQRKRDGKTGESPVRIMGLQSGSASQSIVSSH